MNKRYAFIHFPHFCHQQIKNTKQHEIVILIKDSRKSLYISDLGDKEYDLGLRLNMPLAHAQAIAPNIIYYFHDDDYFKSEFSKLAQEAFRFSPFIAVDENYGILMDISGCSHLFGDEEGMLNQIYAFFAHKGLVSKIAIAPNPLLAKALAYYRDKTICKTTKEHINTLPIGALFIDKATEDMVLNLGINNIKDLSKIPKNLLAKRLGITIAQRIDELNGSISIPPTYLKEDRSFIVNEHFSSVIKTHEHLMERLDFLLQKILLELKEYHFVLSVLTIELKDIFKKSKFITIASAQPHPSFAQWKELVSLKLNTISISKGVDNISLSATRYEKLCYTQTEFSKSTSSDLFITDKIKSYLGDHAVFKWRITHNHWPEHAIEKEYNLKCKSREIKLPPRPLRLFKQPIPISVIALLPDNPPAKIMLKHRSFDVIHASGPERIEDAWWVENSQTFRDYYYIEDIQGKRLWIYSTGDPKSWFIHGIFA